MHSMQKNLFAINQLHHSTVLIFAKLKPDNTETYSICGNIKLSIKMDQKNVCKNQDS